MKTPATQDVTVLDLPYFDVRVGDSILGSDVARIFEKSPSLPGIIVMHKDQFRGMVSRNQFFHRLGRLFGIEVYSTRPITAFLESLSAPALLVPAETSIQNAAVKCLGRPVEYVYDPFVATLKNGTPRLVDFLALILKQTDLLTAAHERLEYELSEAASYLRSLLPSPLQGPIAIESCYQPSSENGGDGFGYHWLDLESLAIYLLDVSGHGVGSALLSTSVLNVLRTQLLANTDFRDPSSVLEGLNRAFPMSSNNDKYFTIWYGVYHSPSRTLTYSSGGHHAAILLGAEGNEATQLRTNGPCIGMLPGMKYPSARIQVPSPAQIYLFSDGVYEIVRPESTWQSWEEFVQFLEKERPTIDTTLRQMRTVHGTEDFDDDFSLLKIDLI